MDEALSAWEVLDRFLATESQDAGCAEAFELLDVWAELVQHGAEPELHLPRVAAHLRACRPCSEDLTGLLEAPAPLGCSWPVHTHLDPRCDQHPGPWTGASGWGRENRSGRRCVKRGVSAADRRGARTGSV